MISINLNIVRAKQSERDTLAADVQRFLAAGGSVQQLAPEDTSQPLSRSMRQANERRFPFQDQ